MRAIATGLGVVASAIGALRCGSILAQADEPFALPLESGPIATTDAALAPIGPEASVPDAADGGLRTGVRCPPEALLCDGFETGTYDTRRHLERDDRLCRNGLRPHGRRERKEAPRSKPPP